MAELSTLARPYARAAFEYAREQRSHWTWSAAGYRRGVVGTGTRPSAPVLSNPALTAEQQAARP